MDLNDFELTDAQKNFLTHFHEPSQKVFILPKGQGKSEAKAVDNLIVRELRRRQEQG